jgi:hypothetical protein
MVRRRFFVSAVAVTALLTLAASVAVTRPLRAGGSRGASLPSSLFNYTIMTLVLVGGVALIFLAPSLFRLRMAERKPRSFAGRVLRTVGILVAWIVVAAMVFRNFNWSTPGKHGHPTGGTSGSGAAQVSFHWALPMAVAGLVGLLVFLAFARRQRAAGPVESRVERLAVAISQSLDDLRADPDLRRAIVAAYARMETALAETGLPRDPAEAPREYLERALLSVDTSAGAARRLTELFERARFSHHEPDARMRDDAIDALVAVRDELWANEAVAA